MINEIINNQLASNITIIDFHNKDLLKFQINL